MKINKNGFEINISEKPVNPTQDGEMLKFWDWYQKDWELDTFKIFERFLNKDYGFLDIGSWIGPTVLFGSHIAKKCYCFEPDKLAFQYLQNNINENSILKDKIKAFEFGVSNKNSKETFYVGSGSTSMSSLKPIWGKENSYQIEICDFPTTIKKTGIDFRTLNFMKIDIEGGEYDLVPSLVTYLKNQQHYPTLYISLHTPYTFSKFWNKNLFLKIIAFIPRKILARFKNQKILRSISDIYKYIYLKNGKRLQKASELGDARAFSEIVATNTEW